MKFRIPKRKRRRSMAEKALERFVVEAKKASGHPSPKFYCFNCGHVFNTEVPQGAREVVCPECTCEVNV